MKYLDEFGDPDLARSLLDDIARRVTRPWAIMEVCGGQTHTIIRNGIDQLLPPEITLIHGPGCPVCVTSLEAIETALREGPKTPDLGGTFPKLARVLRTRPGTAAFGRPASAKAIDTMARAVGLAPRALPARYRALLATFDGATLQGGREVLYGCAQLAAHNPAGERDEHTPLVIGHNLVLQHSSASKNGEAPVSAATDAA